jgi:hypothetical protein
MTPVALSTANASCNNYDIATAYGASLLHDFTTGVIKYVLPIDGNVGATIEGQPIYPTFNNNAFYTPEKCEVDGCNEHTGQGGGIPHLHGDSFGPMCLYSAANYSSIDAHPPHVGFSLDGYFIYGRHLSENAEGYSTILDDCGGHIHGTYPYHYHHQVLQLTADKDSILVSSIGTTYPATTVGVHKCWRADLRQQPYFPFNTSSPSTYAKQPCCGSTAYWLASYITNSNTAQTGVYGAGTQSLDASTFTSTCGATGTLVTVSSLCSESNTSTSSTSNSTASTTTTTSASSSSSALAIGLGVGLGLGIPLILAVVYFTLWRGPSQSKGKITAKPVDSHPSPSEDTAMPVNPPPSPTKDAANPM